VQAEDLKSTILNLFTPHLKELQDLNYNNTQRQLELTKTIEYVKARDFAQDGLIARLQQAVNNFKLTLFQV
jgi:hypothetical protein